MFAFILILATLLIAACAAFFSVTGIGHLFAGAMIPVMIMAGALEFGKLVSVSYLYRYWHIASKALRTYLISASIVLMVITSMGIYGYLTSAYASVATNSQASLNQISLIDTRKQSISQQVTDITKRLDDLNTSRQTTQATLNEVVGKLQYGNNRTTQNAQRQLDAIDHQAVSLQRQRDSLLSRQDSLDTQKTQLQTQVNSDTRIGTFVYVARALGTSLDNVVKWFTLVIVLVFDPLSVSLVLAYNSIIKQKQIPTPIKFFTPEKQNKSEEKSEIVKAVEEVYSGESESKLPYYMQSDYDWERDVRWHSDPQARAWRTAKG